MKSRNNVLSFLSLMTLITLLLFSCAKEQILPAFESNQTISKHAIDQKVESVDDLSIEVSDDLEEIPELTFNSLEEAKEKIEFGLNPAWGIDILSFPCTRRGESLVVYNPNSTDLDFYSSRSYAIYWFKDGRRLVRNTKTQLDCVCKGNYTVIVLNRRTLTAVGIASFGVGFCHPIENAVGVTTTGL